MTGETDLDALLTSMEPVLDPETYVFVTTQSIDNLTALKPLMMFQEAEGTTLILNQDTAEAHGLESIFPCRRITLNVHSSLEAVGFIARISARLAEAGMGVNPVAGYFHDHLFIEAARAEEAAGLLEDMARQ